MAEDEVESPRWWMSRLYKGLQVRQPYIELTNDYYNGEPPKVPWIPEQARSEFRELMKLTKSNYMGLVADAVAERINAEGFRIGSDRQADEDTARIWQANHLDADSDKAILEAIICGCSYMLVAPNTDEPAKPYIYVEHPSQAIVEYVPGSGGRQRAAGLKLWLDDWTGQIMATLYLPDGLYKFVAPKSAASQQEPRWEPRQVPGEEWPAPNVLRVVPLVELANNPRLLPNAETGMKGVSEIADVMCIQDRVAKTLADRLMTQDFGAFPQKWAIGFPETDSNGVPNRVDVGRNRLVTSDVAETKFGQWDSAPLDPYSAAKREDVKDIASRTRTPAQYLLGELTNVNGETLKASESGLVSKTRQRMRSYGEDLETVVRLARDAAGLKTDGAIETIWRNPEFRTEGELVDALVKMKSLSVPDEALWERWGATPAEITRWKAMAEEQAQANPAVQAANALAGNGPPVRQSASAA